MKNIRREIRGYMIDLVAYGDPEVFPPSSSPEPSMTKLAELASIEFETELEEGLIEEEDLDEIAFEVHKRWENEEI